MSVGSIAVRRIVLGGLGVAVQAGLWFCWRILDIGEGLSQEATLRRRLTPI